SIGLLARGVVAEPPQQAVEHPADFHELRQQAQRVGLAEDAGVSPFHQVLFDLVGGRSSRVEEMRELAAALPSATFDDIGGDGSRGSHELIAIVRIPLGVYGVS